MQLIAPERHLSWRVLGLLFGWREELPGKEFRYHRRGNCRMIAAQLRAFGVRPQTFRMGEQLARGYEVADFKEAFSRYLGSEL